MDSKEDTRLPRTDLKGYFQGISQRLDTQINLMTPVIVHSGQMGDNDHQWFADFLRQYLPQRIGVDTGFVVNIDSDNSSAEFFAAAEKPRTQDKSIGPQSDILLLDVLHNAPFCVEKTFRVCPVEMVLGTIEVTRSLTIEKLKEDVDKVARVLELGEKKAFRNFASENPENRPVYGFLVAFDSVIATDTLQKMIGKLDPKRRPTAILIANDRLFTWLGDKVFVLDESPLFKFLALVRWLIERLPLGEADLFKYVPPMAKILGSPPKD